MGESRVDPKLMVRCLHRTYAKDIICDSLYTFRREQLTRNPNDCQKGIVNSKHESGGRSMHFPVITNDLLRAENVLRFYSFRESEVSRLYYF